MPGRSEREEALRLARVKIASPEWRMSGHEQYDVARALLALAADLEAAERERDALIQRNRELHKLNARLSGNALARDLATAREALVKVKLYSCWTSETDDVRRMRDIARSALRSLGES